MIKFMMNKVKPVQKNVKTKLVYAMPQLCYSDYYEQVMNGHNSIQ
jgi:hypothetical protein